MQLSLLRVSVGGLLLQQGNAAGAVKEFQAALDLVPQDQLHQRSGILHNIGVAFLASNMLQVHSCAVGAAGRPQGRPKPTSVQEAMMSFEAAMDEAPQPHTAFNVLICTHVLGHPERCRQAFTQLAQVLG